MGGRRVSGPCVQPGIGIRPTEQGGTVVVWTVPVCLVVPVAVVVGNTDGPLDRLLDHVLQAQDAVDPGIPLPGIPQAVRHHWGPSPLIVCFPGIGQPLDIPGGLDKLVKREIVGACRIVLDSVPAFVVHNCQLAVRCQVIRPPDRLCPLLQVGPGRPLVVSHTLAPVPFCPLKTCRIDTGFLLDVSQVSYDRVSHPSVIVVQFLCDFGTVLYVAHLEGSLLRIAAGQESVAEFQIGPVREFCPPGFSCHACRPDRIRIQIHRIWENPHQRLSCCLKASS